MNTRRNADSRGARESGMHHGHVSPEKLESPRTTVRSADTPTVADTANLAWDPYQVWLTRVKQPREQSARDRVQRRRDETQSTVNTSETARLRALTPAASS